jgi:hypothetical protein
MNIRLLAGAAGAALLLAACSEQAATAAPKSSEAGVEAVKTSAAAPAGYAVRPGYWETRTDDEVTHDCVTPEEARAETYSVVGKIQQEGCTYTRAHFGGGRIDIVGTCDNDGYSGSSSIKGTYSADSVDYMLDLSMKTPGAAEPVVVKTRVQSRRIGDVCPAGEG